MVPSFFLLIFCVCVAFLCVSQQGGFKNTYLGGGEVHVKNFWPKKLREKKSCRIFPSIFLIAFLAVSLHEEPKNTTKYFVKSDLKISKNLKKRYHGTYNNNKHSLYPELPTSLFFSSFGAL
jgi:hypothetical protein